MVFWFNARVCRYCQYKSNLDYYRGKTKSVYEKEPMFQDFVNNIPLSERNMYDADNITRIKHRFNNIMQERWGREVTPDPLKPSLVSIKHKVLEPYLVIVSFISGACRYLPVS